MAQFKDTQVNGNLTAGTITTSGTLTIDGTNVTTKLAEADTLNTKLTKIFGTTYSLAVTPTNGSNYTITSSSCYLVGNLLRIYFAATRSASVSGDISNEAIGTFSVNTGGKIVDFLNASGSSSNSGGAAPFYTSGSSISGNTLTFNINATSYANSTKSPNGFCLALVRIDPSKY